MINRNFQRFIIGVVFGWTASWSQVVVIGWLGWDWTHSYGWLGVITFLDLVPSLLLGPIFAAKTDQSNKRKQLLRGQIGLAITSAILAIGLLFAAKSIWLLAGVALANGILLAYTSPAFFSTVAYIVDKEKIGRATGLFSAAATASQFLGPLLAAGGAASIGLAALVWINTLGYVVQAGTTQSLPKARFEKINEGANSPNSIGVFAGFRYIAGHGVIGPLFILVFFGDGISRAVLSALPGISASNFGSATIFQSSLTALYGLGGGAAALIAARVISPKNMVYIPFAAFAVASAAGFLFTEAHAFWLACGLAVAIGGAHEFRMVAISTINQTIVDEAYRARVMGGQFLVSRAAGSLVALATGALGQIISIGDALRIYIGIAAVAALVVSLYNRKMRAALATTTQ